MKSSKSKEIVEALQRMNKYEVQCAEEELINADVIRPIHRGLASCALDTLFVLGDTEAHGVKHTHTPTTDLTFKSEGPRLARDVLALRDLEETTYLANLTFYSEMNHVKYSEQIRSLGDVEILPESIEFSDHKTFTESAPSWVHTLVEASATTVSVRRIEEIHCETLGQAVQALFNRKVVQNFLCIKDYEGVDLHKNFTASVEQHCLDTIIAHIPLKTSWHFYEVSIHLRNHSTNTWNTQDKYPTLEIWEFAHSTRHREKRTVEVNQILSIGWRRVDTLASALKSLKESPRGKNPNVSEGTHLVARQRKLCTTIHIPSYWSRTREILTYTTKVLWRASSLNVREQLRHLAEEEGGDLLVNSQSLKPFRLDKDNGKGHYKKEVIRNFINRMSEVLQVPRSDGKGYKYNTKQDRYVRDGIFVVESLYL